MDNGGSGMHGSEPAAMVGPAPRAKSRDRAANLSPTHPSRRTPKAGHGPCTALWWHLESAPLAGTGQRRDGAWLDVT